MRGRALAWVAVAAVLAAGHARAAGTAAPPASVKAPAKAAESTPAELASAARSREDDGAYGLALERLRELRARVPLDGDLELATAIDEARANLLDSAWVRLTSPVLSAAMADTGEPVRWRDYPFQREPFWLNGAFEGWYWYVARARAEVALRLGRA